MQPIVAYILLILTVLGGCSSASSPTRPSSADTSFVREVAPQSLPLAGPLSGRDVEISGLAWSGDTLVVLPQYPSQQRADGTPNLYGLRRAHVRAAVTDSVPLDPFPIPLQPAGMDGQSTQYEGCEGIAVVGQTVYLLTEGRTTSDRMQGHVHRGRLTDDGTRVQMVGGASRDLPQQADILNMSYEALFSRGDTVVTLFEANGRNVNESPRALRFGRGLNPLGPVSFPSLEYRVTDATTLANDRTFWVINYFFPGDRERLQPATDPLAEQYPPGPTHPRAEVVERLVQFRYTGGAVRRTDRPPIWLRLDPGRPRNWEGIVRFREGFLLATDEFPETLLAYVPAPGRE